MTISLKELPVNSEVYLSILGKDCVLMWNENLAKYCFTSKVRILEEGSEFFDGHDNKDCSIMYLCVFVDDPEETEMQLLDKELSFTPLSYFTNSSLTLITDPMDVEDIYFVKNDEQMSFAIKNDELVIDNDESTSYEDQGRALGALVDRKQLAYGNAVERGNEIMKVMLQSYYNKTNKTYEIPETLLLHLQIIIRTLDKLNRIINNPSQDLMEENTYNDIVGYALLGANLSGR